MSPFFIRVGLKLTAFDVQDKHPNHVGSDNTQKINVGPGLQIGGHVQWPSEYTCTDTMTLSEC